MKTSNTVTMTIEDAAVWLWEVRGGTYADAKTALLARTTIGATGAGGTAYLFDKQPGGLVEVTWTTPTH